MWYLPVALHHRKKSMLLTAKIVALERTILVYCKTVEEGEKNQVITTDC